MSDSTRPAPPLLREAARALSLLLGPLALKFGLGERGCRCNRFEAGLYRRVNDRRLRNALSGAVVQPQRKCLGDARCSTP